MIKIVIIYMRIEGLLSVPSYAENQAIIYLFIYFFFHAYFGIINNSTLKIEKIENKQNDYQGWCIWYSLG